jgi:hypothetical protein
MEIPVILVKFELNLIFLDISNLIKIRPVGPQFSNADRQAEWRTEGRTDWQKVGQTETHDEVNSRFLNFVNTPIYIYIYIRWVDFKAF